MRKKMIYDDAFYLSYYDQLRNYVKIDHLGNTGTKLCHLMFELIIELLISKNVYCYLILLNYKDYKAI